MTDFIFKTEPYTHQLDAFLTTRDDEEKALFWEMGLGKTWLILVSAAHQYERNVIDGLLILAPSGVHRNWTDLEIPKHLPDRIPRACVTWRSGRMASRTAIDEMNVLLAFRGLAVLAMNVEAVLTAAGRSYVEKFLKRRRTFAVVDESIVIKSPGAARTKAIVALGKRAVTRRICSGVPITQGLLDLYSQYNFLRPALLGYASFFVFKHAFASWEDGYNGRTGRSYEVLKGYKNHERLLALCAPYTLRATKEDCLDLPPKVYERALFTMTAEQGKIYAKLREEYVAELSAMENVSVAHVLTRLLRLQQITSGYWPERREGIECAACAGEGCPVCDDIGMIVRMTPMQRLTEVNPRIKALREIIDGIALDRKILIWCRFRFDVEEVLAAFRTEAVRYDGATSGDARAAAITDFMYGDTRLFVGTPRAGGRGLTLTAASVVIFYSHDFSYEVRAQAEDRAHRIGQERSVTYVDIIAEDTVDERLLEIVAAKRDLAALFDRDPRSWL